MKEKLDRFHQRVVGELFYHGGKVFGPEAHDAAVAEFFGWPDEEEIEDFDLDDHESVFYPWFLFKWRIDPDDDESNLAGPKGLSIVQSYLQTHGRKLAPLEREYLEAQGNAPFSFFEITAVEPGKSVSLWDCILDRGHHVLEKSASGVLHKGDVVFGSVIEAGGIGLFGALSMRAFNPSAKVDILAVRKMMSMATKDQISADTLEEYDMELRDLYIDLFRARTAMPTICNTDGDEISFHTLRYAIFSPQKTFDTLKGLINNFASEEELLKEAEFTQQGDLRKVEIPWLIPSNPKHGGMENTLHGRVVIGGSQMTCEVNSAERAARLRDIIERCLPSGEAVYQSTVIQSAEAMMRDKERSSTASSANEELMALPEVRAKFDEMMRKHWEAWPDMELPALHGKTPRQAVQERIGRQMVNALLEDAERNLRFNEGPMSSMEHISNVRRELGLGQR
jgi:hypothetical protein